MTQMMPRMTSEESSAPAAHYRAEIKRLRKALEFYAHWEESKMFWDEGKTARAALGMKEDS